MPLDVEVDELPEYEELNLTTDEAIEFAIEMIRRKNGIEAAEEILRAVVRMEPENGRAHEFLAVVLDERGRVNEAVTSIEQAIELDPNDAGRWNNYGNVLVGAGRQQRARAAFERAIELDPDQPQPYCNLGVVLGIMEENEAGIAMLEKAIALDPKHHIAWHNKGKILFKIGDRKGGLEASMRTVTILPQNTYRNALGQAFAFLGQKDEARQMYEKWAEDEPDNPIPFQHLQAFLDEAPNRCTDEYVKEVFDKFANNFEAKLKTLGYRAPELVKATFAEVADAPAAQYDILDAGCGTGWLAADLKPFASRLDGVDLSGGMLQRAAALELYDALYEAELAGFMDSNPGAYDRIVVCDTFCYFGDLSEAAASAFKALRPGGFLIATFEADTDAKADERFQLRVSGRYIHAGHYVESAFREAGFEVVSRVQDWLREEFASPVEGWILTVRKP